jgi:hypothetical protein
VHEGVPQSSIHIKSSFASETAVTDSERVFFCFGNLGVFCFDFDGNEVWRHELAAMPMRFGWGTAASPVLHGGRLYYCSDNERQSVLLALDAATGKELHGGLSGRTRATGRLRLSRSTSSGLRLCWREPVALHPMILAGQLLWSTRGGMSSIADLRLRMPPTVCCMRVRAMCWTRQRPIYAIQGAGSGG